ncbi:MAG: phosphoheptose isomerase [Deltaproteobacteria bacterium HGW-Deltaproteobacteria-8]|jgi:D-sedoheptulose 7-phosphate isomerase|nr:MAG: phosphoheptose isomerase [Deltaproteobacteria bacterium HGW-Deltaproteobacteria-8]
MQTLEWEQSILELMEAMRALSVRDAEGSELGSQGLQVWVRRTLEVARREGCAFFAGNGASASMASHFSTDIAKNTRMRTMVFTDPALITCVGNDFCYEDIFAEPLSWHIRPGDMVVLVSSSGNSPNVVKAAQLARERGGMVVTLTAMRPDNTLRGLGDLNFYVPADSYSYAETSHAAILHHWVDAVMWAKSLG